MIRLFCLLSATLIAQGALGAVPAKEAAELQGRLTPLGAERAGSADGRIPAWQGGLAADALKHLGNGTAADPYAGEKPLFVIDASNFRQYQANLSAGQQAMLQRYPGQYRIPVYPSHRSVGVADPQRDWAAHNAANTRLVNGGNGLENFQGALAFPIPRDGLEAIWNHITRYRGGSLMTVSDSAAPQAGGGFVITTTEQRFTMADQVTDYQPGKADNMLFYYSHRITAPSRQVGEVVLVHETLDQVKQPRLSWVYSAGQRRVRRSPDNAYDAAGPTTAGLRTADSRDMYNGAPDRYDWKLVGKKELYIPYNSYRLASPELKYADFLKSGYVDPAPVRYELHRVWEVEATLKPGARHIYSKRRFYLDEDSWTIVENDLYDSRGELWRVGENHTFYQGTPQVTLSAMQVFYDLQAGRYIASNMTNEQARGYDFSYRANSSDYSPGALRGLGIR
ncbi:DUF1329 domain-containing protein [Pseudomonas knackmussii]|uniref:DUF1329 domain-containing protein n=1 Tax=Pseudomonas knackmussii TaxID=65741 RepID=UPI0013639556|nr:DUF1329 domain-containing protein [Pseudomonas knackmussii]